MADPRGKSNAPTKRSTTSTKLLSFCVCSSSMRSSLLTSVNAPGGASLGHNDLGQQRQFRLQLFPNPNRDVFTCGIFQAWNVVQVIMIQLFPNWPERCRDLRIVHHPAQLWIAFARYDNIDFETVSVQPAALVRFGQVRQQVRGFKLKSFS